jgi:hypothetical protein
MATKPAPATVIQFRFSFPDMYTSATKAANAFLHIQKFALNSTVIDRKIGFGMYLDGRVFRVYGTYFGTLANFNDKVCRSWTLCVAIKLIHDCRSDQSFCVGFPLPGPPLSSLLVGSRV